MTWGIVELEPEVEGWLSALDDQRWAQAVFHLDLLEERGVLLGEVARAMKAMDRCQLEERTADEDAEVTL